MGLAAPWHAFVLTLRTPALRALAGASALVTAATLAVLAYLLWPWAQGWAAALVTPETTWARVGAWALGAVAFGGSFLLLALTVPNVVLAPLMDPISERTERAIGAGRPPPQPAGARGWLRAAGLSLQHTLARLALTLMGLVLAFPVNLVPVAGSALWAVFSFVWTIGWVAVEHLSTPAARHGVSFGDVVRRLARRPALTLGLGAALGALLWVPVLNFFVLPVATSAATTLFCALLDAEPSPTRGLPPRTGASP